MKTNENICGIYNNCIFRRIKMIWNKKKNYNTSKKKNSIFNTY